MIQDNYLQEVYITPKDCTYMYFQVLDHLKTKIQNACRKIVNIFIFYYKMASSHIALVVSKPLTEKIISILPPYSRGFLLYDIVLFATIKVEVKHHLKQLSIRGSCDLLLEPPLRTRILTLLLHS